MTAMLVMANRHMGRKPNSTFSYSLCSVSEIVDAGKNV